MKARFVFVLGGLVAACIATGSIAAAASASETRVDGSDEEPLADAGLDQSVGVDTVVQLDGSGSTHPEGTIERYEWSIESPSGRSVEPSCAECKRATFAPTTPGRYVVTLEVRDGRGSVATDTLFVYVDDAGPSVDVTGDRTPNPNEPVEFTASAESSDAELEEIAWSVDDEIVAKRPLDGHRDESTFHFAFTETDTHRVQAVAVDANGRTAYDDVFVQSQEEDEVYFGSRSSNSVNTPEPGCQDADYISDNPRECIGDPIERTPEPTPEVPDGFEEEYIEYATDGFYQNQFAGAMNTGSEFIGQQVEAVGIDGGENAPWRQSHVEQAYDKTLGAASTFLFGQEEETETCQITAGELDSCDPTVSQLENDGRTTNVYSPDESGAYSKYGLEGAERTYGVAPEELEEGQTAEVTIVTQQEEEGAVDRTVDTVKSTSDSLQSLVDDKVGNDDAGSESDVGTESSESSSDILDSYDSSSLAGTRHESLGSSDDVQETNTDSSSSVDLVSDHGSSNWIDNSGSSSGSDSSGGTSKRDSTDSGSTGGDNIGDSNSSSGTGTSSTVEFLR